MYRPPRVVVDVPQESKIYDRGCSKRNFLDSLCRRFLFQVFGLTAEAIISPANHRMAIALNKPPSSRPREKPPNPAEQAERQ